MPQAAFEALFRTNDASRGADRPPDARPILLVVDDDDLIREATVVLLQQHGWTAVAARNGAEALLILERRAVDVVLTDVNMPVLDGWQLAAQVAQRWPSLPVVFMTGDPEQAARLEAHGGEALLKPFACDQLLDVFKRLLLVQPVAGTGGHLSEAAA